MSERASRRRDLALGVGALILTSVPALRKEPSRAETEVFTVVNSLPEALYAPVWPVMQFGALAAVPATATLIRLRGHPGVATRVAVSGVTAWALAKGVKRIVGRGRPDGLVADVRIRGRAQTGRGYLSGHAAVATALAAGSVSAAPSLGTALGVLAVTVGMARIYVGAHLPLDVVGGAALGLAVHAAVNLVTPTAR